MARETTTAALAAVRIFSSLTKRELSQIAGASQIVTVESGDELVSEGTPGDDLYVLLDGAAVVRRRGRKVAALGPGDYFGELSLLDGGPRSASVAATAPSRVLVIAKREFDRVVVEVPGLGHKLLVAMASRLRDADARALSH